MATLNSSNFQTVWTDNFGNDHAFNRSLWPISWGKSDDFSFSGGALTLSSTAAEGWSNTGFMQADFGSSSAQGYGLYSVTASLDRGQGAGVCIDLWPANNQWPGAEIDLLETYDSSRQSGFSTVHWKGANNANDYTATSFKADLTQKNTFAVDWERGSITYYLNGQEIYRNTSHVPLDAADGGVNESLGAEVTNAKYGAVGSVVDLHLYSMSYAKPGSSAAIATSAPTMQFSHASDAPTRLVSGAALDEQGSANTLVLPAAGSAALSGNYRTDALDLRAAMTASGWNHQAADLGSYLSVGAPRTRPPRSVHHAGGGSVLALSLEGQHETLAGFEAQTRLT